MKEWDTVKLEFGGSVIKRVNLIPEEGNKITGGDG